MSTPYELSGSAPTPPPAPDPKTAELIVDTIKWQIEAQDARFDSIRTKATVVLASSGLIFSRLIELQADPEHLSRAWWLWLAAAAVASSFLLALWAVLPHWLRRDPKPRALIDFYLSERPVVVEEQLAVKLRDTYEVNEKSIHGLSRALRFSVVCLGVALIAFVATAGVEWGLPWKQVPKAPAAHSVGPEAASEDTVQGGNAAAELNVPTSPASDTARGSTK